MSSPTGLSVMGKLKHWCTNWAKRRHDRVPAVSSSRAYQSCVAPVAYQTRRRSGVPCPRKNVSQWFNQGRGSSFPSNVRNSRWT
jgi:hypothetical protein